MTRWYSYYGSEDDFSFEPFILPSKTEMTEKLLGELITEYETYHVERYEILDSPFRRLFAIYGREKRESYRPDNRLAVNFCRQIATTFEGYFIGEPVQYRNTDENSNQWLSEYNRKNNQSGVDAQISMGCTKFGRAYELMFNDSEGEPRSAYMSPRNAFVVYDDSIVKEPLFGVTFARNADGQLFGSWSDSNTVTDFVEESGIEFKDAKPHGFGGVPLIEYTQDEAAEGLYEGILSLVDAFNAAISEKANDVEYFADAYLVIAGTELPEDFKKDLRQYRLINLFGEDAPNAYFLQKPNADVTQENLLSRLEVLIHKTAMVPDITDASFYTASGTALTKRLMPMSNLAKTKEQRFKDSIRHRLRLLSNLPFASFGENAWATTELSMKRNMPPDLAVEAQIAGSLAGIVSEETQLSVLSCVDDVSAEIERKNKEREALMEQMYPTLGAENEGNV